MATTIGKPGGKPRLPVNFFTPNTQQQPPPPVFIATAALPPPPAKRPKKSRTSPPPRHATAEPVPELDNNNVPQWIVADGYDTSDTSCCSILTDAGKAERQDFSVIFRQRFNALNISILGAVAHVWELLVIVVGIMSLTNLAVPSSPGIWWPIVVLCLGVLFLVFFLVARFTIAKPDSIVIPTGGWLRNDRYQAVDEWHFWIGFITHVVLGVFELIWAMVKADNLFPIDPLTDPALYTSQQILHTILVAVCMIMFAYFTQANSAGSRRLALAYAV